MKNLKKEIRKRPHAFLWEISPDPAVGKVNWDVEQKAFDFGTILEALPDVREIVLEELRAAHVGD